ncbi:MAG: phosphate acyltransferase PlsX [Rhizobiales bacterium]|nr:phosphate acyltransferase PlsX [Hyphomicrobiales bacterium]
MSGQTTVAVDAMGGDHGPDVTLSGVSLVLAHRADVNFLLVGDEAVLQPLVDADSKLRASCQILHADVQVSMDAKPSQALRSGRRHSGMWKAIEALKSGEADVTVSAGNTGALMAMSKVLLKMMPGIERPAIAAIWPTLRDRSVILDVGATIGADADQLVDFAVMGEAMSRSLFGIDRPTVGLLNVGVEEIKGNGQVKEAGAVLRNSVLPIEYAGFIEGDDIGQGKVDVVVTEGFSGNIALKTAEGTAKQIGSYLRTSMNRNIFCKLGYLLAKSGFDALRKKMDPRTMNGGVFLGLNGIVVKSHGGTDAVGFAHALDLGIDMAQAGMISRIARDIDRAHQQRESSEIPLAAAGGG